MTAPANAHNIFRRLSLILLIGIFALQGCSGQSVKNSENPEEIYNQAVKDIADGAYLEASELLTEIKRRFPQSRFSVLADLQAAHLEFEQENFLEAAALYRNFINLHPKHAEAAFAQYRMAISFLNNTPEKIARDQASATYAARAAKELKERYADSPHAKEADDIYFKARFKLAEKEAYVAYFYRKKKAFQSAILRVEYVLRNFADIQDHPDAKNLFEELRQEKVKMESELKDT